MQANQKIHRRLYSTQALNQAQWAKKRAQLQKQRQIQKKQQQYSKSQRINKFKIAYQQNFGKNQTSQRQQIRIKRDINFDTGILYILSFQHNRQNQNWRFTMRERNSKINYYPEISTKLTCTCFSIKQQPDASCKHINYIFIQVADSLKLFQSIYQNRISQKQYNQLSSLLQQRLILRIQGIGVLEQQADQLCNICFKKRSIEDQIYQCFSCQYQYHRFCVDYIQQNANQHQCYICNYPFPQNTPDDNRILKAKAQKMFILNISRTKKGYWFFSLYGTSLNQYFISMTSAIECTCPDFIKKMQFCKHIYYVLIKMARQEQLVRSLGQLTNFDKKSIQIIDISLLMKWPIFLQESVNFVDKPSKQKFKETKNKHCYICFEKFKNNDGVQNLKTDCTMCSFKYHSICLRNWKHKYTDKFCPICNKAEIQKIQITEQQKEKARYMAKKFNKA